MGARIRDDFDGVVEAYERGKDGQTIGAVYRLPAGAAVPDGVEIPSHLLEPQDGQPAGGEPQGAFDPSTKNVSEVNVYLDGASEAERTRVLALEAGEGGHQRKGVLVDGPYSQYAPTTKGK